MTKLYKFHWDVGRMGELKGLFLAKEEDVAGLMGKEIVFGEVLGKHSEIYGPLEDKDLSVLHCSEEFVTEFKKHFPNGFGYNPFNYLPEEE